MHWLPPTLHPVHRLTEPYALGMCLAPRVCCRWVGAAVHGDRETMEGDIGAEMPTAVVMPVLMWTYQFIIGVLLVNL